MLISRALLMLLCLGALGACGSPRALQQAQHNEAISAAPGAKQRREEARLTHELVMHSDAKVFRRGEMRNAMASRTGGGVQLMPRVGVESSYVSPPILARQPFREALASWNVHTPAGCGFCFELRVGRVADDFWSPWLFMGEWGDASPQADRVTAFAGGRVDVDIFRSNEAFDRFAYRIRAVAGTPRAAELELERVAVCLSGIDERRHESGAALPAAQPMPRLDVPFRSQKTDDPERSGRLCSPTSLAMVLAFHGVERATADVATACYDPHAKIFGNWPRNIQAAFSLGAPGYLTRFSDWSEVQATLARRLPIIASIRVPEPGGLTGAAFSRSDGHLLVLCGIDAGGNVEVNDPAFSAASEGRRTYRKDEFERAWFGGSGGVAYVLLPPSKRR